MDNDNEVMRSLGRLEGKVDSIIVSLNDHTNRMNRIDEDIEDVAKRVGTLEKKQYTLIVIASGVMAAIMSGVQKLFGGLFS